MNTGVSHEGHRQRLKNRFLAEGLDRFEAHNILELLLFYAIPQKDTNELAHALLDRFGSLKGVFDADISELVKVKGIKENAATLIKLIPQLSRAYMVSECADVEVFDTIGTIGEFFVRKYIGETKEVVYLMLLDNGFKLIDAIKLHTGSVNSAKITPRMIIDEVIKHNASMIVIAHNHPNGLAIPSMEDIETTTQLCSTLRIFDVIMIEHILVAGSEYYPLLHETGIDRFKTEEHKKLFRKYK